MSLQYDNNNQEPIRRKPLNGWKIFGWFVITIVIGVGLYFGYIYATNLLINEGINKGVYNVVASISETGNIPFFDNGTIKQISVQQLCSNLK